MKLRARDASQARLSAVKSVKNGCNSEFSVSHFFSFGSPFTHQVFIHFYSSEFHGKLPARLASFRQGRRRTTPLSARRERKGGSGKCARLLIYSRGDLHARALKSELLAAKSGTPCRMVSKRDAGRRKCSVAKRTNRCLAGFYTSLRMVSRSWSRVVARLLEAARRFISSSRTM